MFKKNKDSMMNTEDEAIAAAWDQLARLDVDSDEYASAAEAIAKLLSAQAQKKLAQGKITPSQIFGAGATTLLALVGLNFERVAPITTKAFTFIKSIRL